MAGFVEKVMGSLGFEVDHDDEKEFLEAQPEEEQDFNKTSRRGKVVNINTTTRLNVVVIAPETFEDARDIADHLKAKKPCVVNLESVDREISRRIIDFLSGAVYALDGNIQKISTGIFLIAPYNVSIMGDFKDELRNKGVFPWNY